MSSGQRKQMGLEGRNHVLQNYNFENYQETWVEYMLKIHEEEGSWETRKGYNGIRFEEIA